MQTSMFEEGPIQSSILGLVYQSEFLSAEEEAQILVAIASLPLLAAKYKEYVARRRVMSFGGSYDLDTNRLAPVVELDARLQPLRERVAQWLGVEPEALVHALVSEYSAGTPLGWHRDSPEFQRIVGVSLGSSATLRFRPYPYDPALVRQVVRLDVAPRSIYKIEGNARWHWQHSVDPTAALRWSVTFRAR